MTHDRLWKIAVLLLILTGVASAAKYRKTHPRCLTGLPYHDYHYGSRSPSDVALSMNALLLPASPPATARPSDVRLYQLDRAKLEVDHCSISQVALQLHREGYWVLDLRAYQNPVMQPDEVAVSGEKQISNVDKFTLHLKRNQFFVKIRAYGAFQTEEKDRDSTPGKPVMLTIGPEAFWVQRGEPFDLHRQQVSREVAKYFDFIDRVEVEFYYK